MSIQTWKVILIAAVPGALACAALGIVEFSDRQSLTADLLGAYPVALLAFLPGIPVLAMTVVRALPPREWSRDGRRVRPGWLVLSWFAPWWHVGAAAIAMRALHVATPIQWSLVGRHSVCLWFVTVCGWLCVSSRPQRKRVGVFTAASTSLATPRPPTAAGGVTPPANRPAA